MALTITNVKKLVMGSRRVNQATLAINTTSNNAMTPAQVGMHTIEGVNLINPSTPPQVGNILYDGTNLKVYDTTGALTTSNVTGIVAEFIGW